MEVHSAGFVNIIGNPNVGKSTLLNAWVGEKLSIISSKSQTTRHRILGIVNGDDFQMVLSDTPGIIKPAYKMQEHMMDFVKSAITDADILVVMVEPEMHNFKDEQLIKSIEKSNTPMFVLLNKVDKCEQDQLESEAQYWKERFPLAEFYPISALHSFNTVLVLNRLIALLPKSPPYFPKNQITDKPERFFVNEVIREKILHHYKKEIPYAVEIQTDEFIETEDLIKISAVILTERESQKGILIGHRGRALKRVGVEARKDLERFFDKKIYLNLFVKVNKNWRSNPRLLKRFGYSN